MKGMFLQICHLLCQVQETLPHIDYCPMQESLLHMGQKVLTKSWKYQHFVAHNSSTLTTSVCADLAASNLFLNCSEHVVYNNCESDNFNEPTRKLIPSVRPRSDSVIIKVGLEVSSHHVTYLHSSLWEAEPLLHDGSQFSNAPAFLAQHILCPCCQDDDLRPGRSDPHLHPTVAILRQLLLEEAVQLSLEQPITHELRRGVERWKEVIE